MTDTEKLKSIIESKGYKLKFVAEYLGLSAYGFNKKLNNQNEFKTSEISALCSLLEIDSLDEKENIFFAH